MYDSFVLSQSGSRFVLSRITYMNWPRIMESACPRSFSNHEFLSQYVLHSFSFSTLASPYRIMGSMCWLLYSASTISSLRIAKEILDLVAMVDSTSMTSSSRIPFWNCHKLARCRYHWSLLSVAIWCSYNKYLMWSSFGILAVFLFSNSLIISCPCIVLTLCTIFS